MTDKFTSRFLKNYAIVTRIILIDIYIDIALYRFFGFNQEFSPKYITPYPDDHLY